MIGGNCLIETEGNRRKKCQVKKLQRETIPSLDLVLAPIQSKEEMSHLTIYQKGT
jgi:hypothetical protein